MSGRFVRRYGPFLQDARNGSQLSFEIVETAMFLSQWFAVFLTRLRTAMRSRGQQPWRRQSRRSSSVAALVELLEPRRVLSVSPLGAAADTSLVNSGTLAGFTVSAGSNRLLVVTASDANATDVTGVTFRGRAMTQAVERSDSGTAVDSIWYLVLGTSAAPETGDIVMSSNAVAPTHERYLSAVVFAGVNQATPTSSSMSADALTGSSSLTVSSAVGDLVYDLFDTFHNGVTPTPTIGGGQTSVSTASGAVTGGGLRVDGGRSASTSERT